MLNFSLRLLSSFVFKIISYNLNEAVVWATAKSECDDEAQQVAWCRREPDYTALPRTEVDIPQLPKLRVKSN